MPRDVLMRVSLIVILMYGCLVHDRHGAVRWCVRHRKRKVYYRYSSWIDPHQSMPSGQCSNTLRELSTYLHRTAHINHASKIDAPIK